MSHHRYTEHHKVPQSRGGKETVELPEAFHEAWHVCFQNLYGKEIQLFIKDLQVLFEQKEKVTAKEIHELREEIKSMEVKP